MLASSRQYYNRLVGLLIHNHSAFAPYTRHLRLGISSYPLKCYSFPQLHRVTSFHPSPSDKPRVRGRAAGRTNTGTKHNWPLAVNHLHICTKALHFYQYFAHCRAASSVIHLLHKATFTPSI